MILKTSQQKLLQLYDSCCSHYLKFKIHVAIYYCRFTIHAAIITVALRFMLQWILMDLHEVGGGCGDRMELAQDRERWRALVSTVMNFRVP